MVQTLLLATLGLFALLHVVNFARRTVSGDGWRPSIAQLLIGFVTNFFDTLGIGNFAPTAAAYRWLRIVPDERIPGTMNVGHTLPVVLMAFIFIGAIEVDATTLVVMIVAAIIGAWLGAGTVTALPRSRIQLGMGLAMLVAAGLFVMAHFEAFPVGGSSLELEGVSLVFGAIGIFVFGAMQTIGVGLYAPCMILVALLGMNPKAAFPIMMGACAFLMPVASARFVRARQCDRAASIGLTIGGLPAVVIAFYLVESMSLTTIRWLVIVVSAVTGVAMIWSSRSTRLPTDSVNS